MNIVFCKWKSICETGVDNGLVARKHNIIRITRPLDNVDYDMAYADLLSDTLKAQPVDCVFSINFIPIIARVCKIHNIPYLCWIVDSPCLQLYSETVSYDTNYIFIFDRDLYNKFYPDNPHGIFHHSLASDIPLWDSIQVTKEEHKAYDCDISFVGSLYSDKVFSLYNKIEQGLPEYIRGYVNGIIDAQLNIFGYNLIRDSLTPEFVKEFKAHAKWIPLNEDYAEDDIGIIADTYIGYKCTEQDRIRSLNALAQYFHVDLYTTSDTSCLTGVNVRGPADSAKMMPQILKCSKINLNFTNKPISSGLPLRCFDIMGNGGFMLSNYQPEIPELFELDKEVVVYESMSDMLEKAGYYLEHEDERIAIAKRGYEKVKQYHSYEVKLNEMFHMAGLL